MFEFVFLILRRGRVREDQTKEQRELLLMGCFGCGKRSNKRSEPNDTVKNKKTIGGTSDKRDDQSQPCSGTE